MRLSAASGTLVSRPAALLPDGTFFRTLLVAVAA